MSRQVLVTGAAGHVGARVVAELGRRGWTVRALCHRRRVEAAQTIWGDICDPGTLEAAVAGVDAILHLAAVTHERDPSAYDRVNVGGTRHLVAAATALAVGRFVFASSRAVDARGGAYSRSKREAERLVRESGLDATIVRLPELYGAGGDEGVDRIARLVRDGRRVPVVGSGGELVCPVHVDDAAAALVSALSAGAASGKTYTLSGDCLSLASFVRACAAAFDSRSRPVRIPVPLVRAASAASRFLPLPLYPDQLDRLRAPKTPVSPEATHELGFSPRPLAEGLRDLARAG